MYIQYFLSLIIVYDCQRKRKDRTKSNNQPTNQTTNQPESQPLGSLPRPMNIYGNVRKRATVETSSTLCSRLESLNISENGLICSLLNLSPLRKSMVCSILLLISSGPDWTCKACARWFGSRFIEFLVRAARVQGESTCKHNKPASPLWIKKEMQCFNIRLHCKQ